MDNLPNIIMEPKIPVMVGKLDDILLKQFVLCITRDLTEEDKRLFSDYKLLEYDDNVHKNIPISALRFDFLIIDLRQKGDRYAMMKHILPQRDLYHILVYCHGFETDDIEFPYDNALSSFPQRQATRQDWESLLLMHRIKKPVWWVSLFSCILNFYNKSK